MRKSDRTPGVTVATAVRPAPAGDPALARYLADRSEEAFAELVAAHGRMVLGTCRRVLGNPADAEDAFQATFLVLARDAASVADRRIPVGGWLYGTAVRMAKMARRTAARRAARELRRPTPMTALPDPNDEAAKREAERLVDAELGRLPGRLRQPVALCVVAGLTHDQAAAELGVHPRTLERRLKDGLETLRGRLVRRGVVLSAGAVAAVLATNGSAAAAVPPAVVAATAKAAVGYAAGATAGVPPAAAALAGSTALPAWVAGIGAAAAVGLAAAGLLLWNGRRPPAPPPVAAVAAPVQPAAPAPRPLAVAGRLLGGDDRPLAGVTVLLLNRPVRRTADGKVEPVPDPAATVTTRRGRFRELARAVTDADGRFLLVGERTVPDPVTGAKYIQFHPFAVNRPGARFADVQTEFDAVHLLPGDGG